MDRACHTDRRPLRGSARLPNSTATFVNLFVMLLQRTDQRLEQ
jgi:hypothetical protein